MNNFKVTLKNNEGEKSKIEVDAMNEYAAKKEAEYIANETSYLPGNDWLAYFARLA